MNCHINSIYCKVQLNNRSGDYLVSQPIDGQVEINLRSDSRCRGIKVELLCYENTKFYSEHNNSGKSIEQLIGKNELLRIPIWLYGAENESHSLQAGRHTYPFAFHLPPNAPPSIQFDYGIIVYEIKATVVIPFFTNFEENVIFRIKSPVDLNFLATADDLKPSCHSIDKTVSFFCIAEGEITMDIQLPRKILIPNDAMTVVLKLSNMSNLNVYRVELELLQIFKFKAVSESKETTTRFASMSRFGVKAHNEKVFTFDVHLPENISVPNLTNGNFITVKYEYKATAFLPPGYTDMVLTIPILVGDVPLRHETVRALNNPRPIRLLNPIERINPRVQATDSSEGGGERPPPSYESLGL